MELQIISEKIIDIRGQRVMLDVHLAELYEVETRQLKQAVRRNMERFPPDFVFEISNEDRNLLIDSMRVTVCDLALKIRHLRISSFHRTRCIDSAAHAAGMTYQ